MLADPREPELVFDFPFDEELNEAVKRLPRRWFDWRRKHWRVPAEPRAAKAVAALLAHFPQLSADPDVLAWLSDSDRWRAAVSVIAHEGAGVFIMRTLSGDPPDDLDGVPAGEGRLLIPFDAAGAARLSGLEGVQLDDLARACARELEEGREPAPAELTLELGDDGEPALTIQTRWDPEPAQDFKRLSEARPVPMAGRFYTRHGGWGVAVPADPALAPQVADYLEAHPQVEVDERAADVLAELQAEYDRASETVALSYADDAELRDLPLGGELHPFQRAGVRYALARRRTFIADEQGLGKTVQALATIEADGAFPTVVVCPASMKLVWERETQKWLPHRSVAVLEGRTDEAWTEETDAAEIVVINYDILEAHVERLAGRKPRALGLDQSP